VLVEYVSANPTGDACGHGRGAAVGRRLYVFSGGRLRRRQRILYQRCRSASEAPRCFANARFRELAGRPTEFPQDGYTAPTLEHRRTSEGAELDTQWERLSDAMSKCAARLCVRTNARGHSKGSCGVWNRIRRMVQGNLSCELRASNGFWMN